jgi:hypothetical protein
MADDDIQVAGSTEEEIRAQAVSAIKRKRAFQQTLLAYLLVNAMLVAIWAIGGRGFFWPGFVLAGWGIGLVFQGYDAYGRRRTITEEQIQREARRIREGG